MKRLVLLLVVLLLAGCATRIVRQQDLNAWVGVPVEALDTHSLFITIPMARTISSSGVEIRNYANGADASSCFTSAGASTSSRKYVSANAFTTCSNNRIVCNNIFYIKDGKIVEYAPTGSCYTDETLQPQARYRTLLGKN